MNLKVVSVFACYKLLFILYKWNCRSFYSSFSVFCRKDAWKFVILNKLLYHISGRKFTYLLTFLLTYSMVKDIIWKANCHSACQICPASFMEPEGLLPFSQKPATETFSVPIEFSSPIDNYLPKIHLTIILTHRLCLPSGLLPSGLRNKTL